MTSKFLSIAFAMSYFVQSCAPKSNKVSAVTAIETVENTSQILAPVDSTPEAKDTEATETSTVVSEEAKSGAELPEPVLTISEATNINNANLEQYSVVGECSLDSYPVKITIASLSFDSTCSGNVYLANNIDLSTLADGDVIISVSQTNDEGTIGASSHTVNKDTATPTVSISSSPNISQANASAYTAYGTCSESSRIVTINFSGTLNFYPICSSGHWSINNVDVSLLSDGSIILTADHDNDSSTPAEQASTNITKDSLAPTVTISQADDINSSNELSYQAIGTCSDDGQNVDVNLAGLPLSLTCSNGTWNTGFQDLSSLEDGSYTVTADHKNASDVAADSASVVINKSTTTPSISNFSVASTLSDSASLVWTLVDPGGFTIEDYEIQYRVSNSSLWLPYADGVSLLASADVNGLSAGTSYEFRARVHYADDKESSWLTASAETKPDNALFDSPYKAMNVGGATDATVVAFENNTNITLNGSDLITLNEGETHQFVSAQFDVIDADKPIYTAGRRGSGGDNAKANMTFSPSSWAGKSFSFNSTRENAQKLAVYPIEDGTVNIYQGSTLLVSSTVTAGVGTELTWSVYGSYQVRSTANILAFHYANGGGNLFVDPKPLLPSHNEIIGVPSRSARLTVDNNATYYNFSHSGGSTSSGTLDRQDSLQVNGTGDATYYKADSLLVQSSDKISAASFADADGWCASVFLPTNLLKTKYAVNVASTYISFAGKESGTISVYSPGQVIGVDTPVTTLTLEPRVAGTGLPSKAYYNNPPAGYRFISDVPMAAWYQAATDVGAAKYDETILYGSD